MNQNHPDLCFQKFWKLEKIVFIIVTKFIYFKIVKILTIRDFLSKGKSIRKYGYETGNK